MLDSEVRLAKSQVSGHWWVFLISGIAWLIISVVLLRFNTASVATVGLMLGFVFVFAAVHQFGVAAVQGGGWAVFRVLLGILFIGGAIWSFVQPYDAFWSLAAAFGVLLIITGAFDITYSAIAQPVNPVWWLGLITGILEILLGFWASQQYITTRAGLLIIWVAVFAIFRGISDLVLAFEVRSTD
jgi:uncharacterized membrane protein HdeD (DUF308 family)